MLARKGPEGEVALDALLHRLDIEIVSFKGNDSVKTDVDAAIAVV